MKMPLVILILMLLAVVLSAGCIQEPEIPEPQLYPMPPVSDDYEYYPHAGSIDSEEAYFTGLNEHYNLGLTEEEIQKYAKELRNGYLKDAVRDGYHVHINDLVEFHTVVAEMINLDPAIYEEIILQIISPPENDRSPTEGPVSINVDWYLSRINDMYGLCFTEGELQAYSDEIKNGYFKDAERVEAEPGDYILVYDMVGFLNEIARLMNLDEETRDDVIIMFKDVVVY